MRPAELWFWIDPHLGHKNIISHCNRPFANIAEMDRALITNYQACVAPNDTVIFAGDFAWHSHVRYLAQLPGNKIMILGNHDNLPPKALCLFAQVVGARHQPGILEMHVGPYEFTVCHFPLDSWNKSYYGAWHIHGHCHGRKPEHADMLRADLGVDLFNYSPVNFEVARLKFKARIVAWKARREQSSTDYFAINQVEATDLLLLANTIRGNDPTIDFNRGYTERYKYK